MNHWLSLITNLPAENATGRLRPSAYGLASAWLIRRFDMGGIQTPEAAGVESVLAGLRDGISGDDQLLAAALAELDGLLAGFNKEVSVQ